MASDILIVDDEADIRELVAGILEDEGHETRIASNSDQALQSVADRAPRLIFLDIWLQGSRLDGLDMLDAIKAQHPEIPVVMISGHGNIETAVSAIRRGAYDYIEKPFKADRLVLVAERALEHSKLKREVTDLRRRSSDSAELLGKSHPMNQLRSMIERVAPTNSRVMILGGSGSGKEMVARAIHAASARSKAPFVALNAAAITPDRMEIELFGTETPPGVERKIGAFEEAHGGVLYLDEVGDMPRETQNKILRVLTDQTFERVGGVKKVKVDVRIISSTAQNLESLIAEGSFREDLFHRLAVVPIPVPPLSERRADIPILIEAFMKQIGEQTGIRTKALSPEALAVLQSSDWPGNIRQLRNNIERLMILSRQDGGEAISADMLPHEISDMLPRTPSQSDGRILALPLRDAREVFEKEYLVAQINRFGGNISRTAEFVGMERSALHRKLKSLGI